MTSDTKDFLNKHQLLSMKRRLPKSLEYHFSNFKKLERLANLRNDPEYLANNEKDRKDSLDAMFVIMFEVQAYINQARRLRYFLKNIVKKQLIEKPTSEKLSEVWEYFMDANGLITYFGNKWSAHRSYDDPRNEDTEQMHSEVLLNLDNSVTFWEDNHLVVYLGEHSLKLHVIHNEIIDLINWVFEQPKIVKLLEEFK